MLYETFLLLLNFKHTTSTLFSLSYEAFYFYFYILYYVLSISWNEMNPGQIIDYCIEYNNSMIEYKNVSTEDREANQNDFDKF